MRQVISTVPKGKSAEAISAATKNKGQNLFTMQAQGDDGPVEIVFIHLPNNKLEDLIEDIQKIDNAKFTINPRGVVQLLPPIDSPPGSTVDVTTRSPIEILLGGLQSVGSWKGFIGYAVCAAIVAWTGLFTNTVYLLTASMLIAPFAGPAMTLSLGTARGDSFLIKKSLTRYFASLLVSVACAFVMSFIIDQKISTELMTQTSLVSSAAVLLPLVAGAAGALNLCQDERDSLVTAAGPGMLVAASLAPPTAVIGMAAAIGKWEMVVSSSFVLLIQLVGINLAGSIVFALFGVNSEGARFKRGKSLIRKSSYAITVSAILCLLAWQFWDAPNLNRSSLSKRLSEEVQTVIDKSKLAKVVEANSRFTRSNIKGQNSLLVIAYVQRKKEVVFSDEEIKKKLRHRIARSIREKHENVMPLVEVTILQSPINK